MSESVGSRIKALRIERGLTLAKLSQRANISISYLSQIERDKTTPSLNTLTGIARAFDVGLRYFFETDDEVANVVRAHDNLDGSDPSAWLGRVRLTIEEGDDRFEVYRMVIRPHTPPQQRAPYPGEEFGFVLAGELTVTLGGEQFELAIGDSIHYDALQPHAWSNQGNEPCVLIWARSPSRLGRQS